MGLTSPDESSGCRNTGKAGAVANIRHDTTCEEAWAGALVDNFPSEVSSDTDFIFGTFRHNVTHGDLMALGPSAARLLSPGVLQQPSCQSLWWLRASNLKLPQRLQDGCLRPKSRSQVRRLFLTSWLMP